MLVICFDKNVLLGGLGDRVVGLISIKVISKLLRRPFYILWNKEDIKEYIDYSEYDYELLEPPNGSSRLYNYICLLYTSPSPRDRTRSRMPSSA